MHIDCQNHTTMQSPCSLKAGPSIELIEKRPIITVGPNYPDLDYPAPQISSIENVYFPAFHLSGSHEKWSGCRCPDNQRVHHI